MNERPELQWARDTVAHAATNPSARKQPRYRHARSVLAIEAEREKLKARVERLEADLTAVRERERFWKTRCFQDQYPSLIAVP